MSNTINLMDLIFAGARQRVLAVLLLDPEKTFHVRELSRITDVNPGTLNRELAKLEEAEILKSEVVGNQVRYSAKTQHILFEDLASMFRKTHGVAAEIRKVLNEMEAGIDVAWVFGSIAKGTHTSVSDIDLFVVGSVDFVGLVRALHPLHATLNREVNPVIYSRAELKRKLAKNDRFISEVLASPKIFVKGSIDDVRKLTGNKTSAGT